MTEINTNTNKVLEIEVVGKPKDIPLILNEDQTRALEYYNQWFTSTKDIRDDRLLKKLTGAAGTGKTTLVSAILELAKIHFKQHKICICAPTHKAKKVIETKTKWQNCETIQALLGIKLDTSIEDFDVNNPAFNPIGELKMNEYDVVIIDESSMINTQLYSSIEENAIRSGCHILFVGDRMQLPPVKENTVSPSLLSPEGYELTQIVRQGNTNPLLNVLGILRDDIENGTNNYLEYLINNPHNIKEGVGGYQMMDRQAFANKMETMFSSPLFKEDKNFCRYLAWTNKSIQDVNKYIRKVIFKHTEPLVIGELLLSYKTVQAVKGDNIILINSDDYLIESFETIQDANYGLKLLIAKVTGLDTGKSSVVNFVFPEFKNHELYQNIHDSLVTSAKRRGGRVGWKPYYDFKNSFQLLENIYDGFVSDYPKVAVKKDIDYGYGITTHKSQGSTYNTVFVNGKDIMQIIGFVKQKQNRLNKEQYEQELKDAESFCRKMFYVALSRASNEVYITMN